MSAKNELPIDSFCFALSSKEVMPLVAANSTTAQATPSSSKLCTILAFSILWMFWGTRVRTSARQQAQTRNTSTHFCCHINRVLATDPVVENGGGVSHPGQRPSAQKQLGPLEGTGTAHPEMPPGWRSVPLVLAATLRFWGCLTGDFVYDDDNIVRHPVVTFKQPWTDAFTTDFWGLPMTSRFSHKSYRPLAVLSFRWHAAIVPMVPGNTLSYHAVNVALHVANVLALWHLAARLLPSAQATTAYLSALAFAIHPLVSETVRMRGFR